MLSILSIFNNLLLIAHSNDYFAVLRFDLYLHKVFVFDGLNYKVNWKDHIINILRQYALVPLHLNPKCKQSSTLTQLSIGVNGIKQRMEFQFGKEAPWIMTNSHFPRQRDGHNCSTIAFLKIMEVFGYIDKGTVEVIAQSPNGYCHILMNLFADLVSKYDNVLFIEMQPKGDE